MLIRKDLSSSEIYELLSICSLSTKQLNSLLFLKKEAQQFKKFPLIQREKIHQLSAGRPSFYMSVKPNLLSLVSLKRGELLTNFSAYVTRKMGWLVCQYKRLSEVTVSVMIFDTKNQKQYEKVHLHFVTHQEFKESKLVKGSKNIFLCEDNLFINVMEVTNNMLYFTSESNELRVLQVQTLGSSQSKRSNMNAIAFNGLVYFFKPSTKEYIVEINNYFMKK
ncbi:hypothetical protein D1Z30_11675 [Enterococcus faecalis]|nr:hypothetical protein [Enterococcus faecalis]